MFNRTNLLIVCLAVAGALGGFLAGGWLRAPSSAPTAPVASALIGNLAPKIALPDLAGAVHSLGEWHGKLVLVNFWASWCGPCREEMPLLDRTQRQLAARGVQVIGIASDTRAATAAFLRDHPVGYPVLLDDADAADAGGDVSVDYGNTRGVLPYSVLVGRDGRVLAQRFGNFSEAGLRDWLAPHL